jgi:hypothetical protein
MAKAIFRKKKPFQKAYKIYNTKKDFGLKTEHNFAMAADPSRDVLMGLIESITDSSGADFAKMSEEEKSELNDRFFYYVSEVVIECDIEGISFDNPETTESSMLATDIDWHFMFNVLGAYIQTLLATHETLGKAFRTLEDSESSGEEE